MIEAFVMQQQDDDLDFARGHEEAEEELDHWGQYVSTFQATQGRLSRAPSAMRSGALYLWGGLLIQVPTGISPRTTPKTRTLGFVRTFGPV